MTALAFWADIDIPDGAGAVEEELAEEELDEEELDEDASLFFFGFCTFNDGRSRSLASSISLASVYRM